MRLFEEDILEQIEHLIDDPEWTHYENDNECKYPYDECTQKIFCSSYEILEFRLWLSIQTY